MELHLELILILWNIQGNKIIIDIIENDERKIIIKDLNPDN